MGGAYIRRGLSTEGNFAFENRLGQLVKGRKFTIFALLFFVFEGKFQVQAPPGGLYPEGRFNEGFFALGFWGAYIWRGLFSEFYGSAFISKKKKILTREQKGKK